jgi:hypothetical protein
MFFFDKFTMITSICIIVIIPFIETFIYSTSLFQTTEQKIRRKYQIFFVRISGDYSFVHEKQILKSIYSYQLTIYKIYSVFTYTTIPL